LPLFNDSSRLKSVRAVELLDKTSMNSDLFNFSRNIDVSTDF